MMIVFLILLRTIGLFITYFGISLGIDRLDPSIGRTRTRIEPLNHITVSGVVRTLVTMVSMLVV